MDRQTEEGRIQSKGKKDKKDKDHKETNTKQCRIWQGHIHSICKTVTLSLDTLLGTPVDLKHVEDKPAKVHTEYQMEKQGDFELWTYDL